MHLRRRLLVLALAAAGVALLAPAGASALDFSSPLKLPNTPPKGKLQGGEPSVAFDPGGRWTYVVAPGGGSNGGVGFWRSRDGGQTFPSGKSLGSLIGGGDADVSIGPDGTVFVADLEAVANALCRSTDHGKHFDSNCDTGIATNQLGPDSDREWVTPSPSDPKLVYFSYHDLATETPLVYVSTTGGDPGSFTPCGPVLAPGSDAAMNYIPGGTNVGKMQITPDGSLYMPILEPTNPAFLTSPYNNFYMAIAPKGCDGSTTFNDVTVYSNPNANLANIFPYVAQDGAGNLYAAFTGISGQEGKHYGVYVMVSHSNGHKWQGPFRADPPTSKAAALGSLAAGPGPGDIALGFYTTRSTDNPNANKNRWKFETAVSQTGGQSFEHQIVTPKTIHYGQICNLGILCTGGRNLLDFSSIAVNPQTGCALTVFAGDPFDTPKNKKTKNAAAYVSRQQSGCF